MHYCVYLDEFGHVGPYISCDHPKHNDHPIFGLAGLAIPANQVRHFNTWFYQLKGRLLKFEIEKALKEKGIPEYQWEKKGASLFTVTNVVKYRQLRQATNRIINKISEVGGFIFYVGQEKPKDLRKHHPKKTYHYSITETLKKTTRGI